VTTQLEKSPFTAGTGPVFLTTDPAGNFLYVCNQTAKTVSQFAINQDTGGIPASTTSTTTQVAPAQLVFAK
jgi:6-phosphogluconolactonase (cycloisomerase 2 family)